MAKTNTIELTNHLVWVNDFQAVAFFTMGDSIVGSGIVSKMDSSKNECYFCHRQDVLDKHHILPRANGGKGNPENILHLCPSCHRLLHTKKVIDLVSGDYIVRYNKGEISISDKNDAWYKKRK